MRFLPRKQLKKLLHKRDIAIRYICYIRSDSVEIVQQDALVQPRQTSFEAGPDELYMNTQGTLALEMLKKSYRWRNLKTCFSFVWGVTQRSPHLVTISSWLLWLHSLDFQTQGNIWNHEAAAGWVVQMLLCVWKSNKALSLGFEISTENLRLPLPKTPIIFPNCSVESEALWWKWASLMRV